MRKRLTHHWHKLRSVNPHILAIVIVLFLTVLVSGQALIKGKTQSKSQSIQVLAPTNLSPSNLAAMEGMTMATPSASVSAKPPTPSNWSTSMGQWKPNPKFDTCTQAEHDSFSVVGPDDKLYPTWHPPVFKRADGTNCTFGHEHGADPSTSKANSTLPAFGYIAAQMGMVESHAGFKVFVFNAGETIESNVANKVADEDVRVVYHMGTGGVKRYTEEFHSVQYDIVKHDGSGAFAHVQAMSDTGTNDKVGSTCSTPRKGGRDFSTIGCQDPYEIWSYQLLIHDPKDPFRARMQSRFSLAGSVATFDPILTHDPSNNSKVVFSQDYYYKGNSDPASPQGSFQGCHRETYTGGEWNNAGKPTVYYTDANGYVKSSQPEPGLLKQEFSSIQLFPTTIWKAAKSYCGNGIHNPN